MVSPIRSRPLSLGVMAMLVVAMATSCSREPGDGPGRVPPEPSRSAAPGLRASVPDASTRKLGASIGAFALDLYGKLRTTPGNLAVSPASIALATTMIHAGARGRTAEEVARAMHFGQSPAEQYAAAAAVVDDWNRTRDLARGLPDFMRQMAPSHRRFELTVANRIFLQQRLPLARPFDELMRQHFAASLERIDIAGAPEEARRRVNVWVSERTAGRITSLLPPGAVQPDSRIVLASALFLWAGWADRFLPEETSEQRFMADGAREVLVPMMHGGGNAALVHDEASRSTALELALVDRDFSVLIVLPDAVDGLPALEARLSTRELSRWLLAEQVPGGVDVRLPRFRIEPAESIRLRAALAALGVKAIFDPRRCDLRAITRARPPLVLNELFHQASVLVNEDGVVAAAATAATMGVGAAPPTGGVFTADHPFLFFVRDRRTDAILFMGRVTDPSR